MTQSPAGNGNAVNVKPGPNIYTVLMIIAIFAMLVSIIFAGHRLMSDPPAGYGLSAGDMFKPFEQYQPTVDTGTMSAGQARPKAARSRRRK